MLMKRKKKPTLAQKDSTPLHHLIGLRLRILFKGDYEPQGSNKVPDQFEKGIKKRIPNSRSKIWYDQRRL